MEEQLEALKGREVTGMIYQGVLRRGYVVGVLESQEGANIYGEPEPYTVWRIRQAGKKLGASFGFLPHEVTSVSGNTVTIRITP